MASILLCTLVFVIIFCQNISLAMNLETYIIHLAVPDEQVFPHSKGLVNWYSSYLPNKNSSRIIHTYKNVFSGFAAKLSIEELKEIEKKEGVLYARPEKIYKLQTTYSPNFLGLYKDTGVWPSVTNYGKGIIIGVIDSGIVPDHPSFSDDGMLPPPSRWKGECQFHNVSCNNKLIGARTFLKDGLPVDESGHGTHTSSTAVGNFVPGANIFGQANGTASGVAPFAHIAMYKVCNLYGCNGSAILAAMDAAIEDGVDVLSISLAGDEFSFPFYEHPISIGAFAAAKRGILVSCAAGNEGPTYSKVDNGAPWILTVGASTMSRKIMAIARLGNNNEFEGETIFQPNNFSSSLLPLVDGGFCDLESLENAGVSGKIVLCEGKRPDVEEGKVVKEAGATAMILMNTEIDGNTILINSHILPTTKVSYSAGEKIKAYISLTSSPTATILFKGTSIGDKSAPSVASFSSRGPNMPSPGILKPDIIGPGVNILAAWHQTFDDSTDEKPSFYMASGTSMACPHLSGIAALVRYAHPLWSPAMIKSAIMTSAVQVNLDHNDILDERSLKADVFAIGAGHVDPSKAVDPGLVYDISIEEYISYLCFLYNDKQVSIIVNKNIVCRGSPYESIPEAQLNYPSFAVELRHGSHIYLRTVTNVGAPRTMYTVKVEGVPGVDVVVEPNILSFTEVNEKLTFKVNFTRKDFASNESYVQGSIAWISDKYYVRIPISVKLPAEAKSKGLHVGAVARRKPPTNFLLVCVFAYVFLTFVIVH